MNKLFFRNDYGEGAHPLVLDALTRTNMAHTCGYGLDDYSLRAADLIREKCGCPHAAVHMMTGGTSANLIALSAFLRPYEAAIAAQTGHICVHETGAIEGSGHKVLIAGDRDGKVLPDGVEAVVRAHTDEHMVHPRVVYISQPTEIGTVYSLSELRALRAVCDAVKVPVIASGGAGCIQDFITLFNALPRVDAGLAASIFHFGEVTIADLKRAMKDAGIPARIV